VSGTSFSASSGFVQRCRQLVRLQLARQVEPVPHPDVADARMHEDDPHGLPSPESSSTARNASWGTSTRPTCFIRFFPSFCFSSSLRFRVTSPP
jgi:hypothetical protein